MLQTAAAAFSVQRAKWFHAIGASFQNFDNTALGKILLLESKTHLTDFARQGSRYKTHATIFQASQALAPLHHLFDAEREAFTTRFATRAAAARLNSYCTAEGFKNVCESQSVHGSCKHTDVIGACSVHSAAGASSPEVAAAYNNSYLSACVSTLLDAFADVGYHIIVESGLIVACKSFAADF